jgi:hypothetical protein
MNHVEAPLNYTNVPEELSETPFQNFIHPHDLNNV